MFALVSRAYAAANRNARVIHGNKRLVNQSTGLSVMGTYWPWGNQPSQ